MESNAPFCTAPLTWRDGLASYPPSESYRWNTAVLRSGDLDEEFYKMINMLEKRHQQNEFTDADFAMLNLTFSVLTAGGQQYNLIPNGSEICVTKSNAYEYFHRIHHAYATLRHQADTSPYTSPPSTVRLRSTTSGLRLTEHDMQAIVDLRWDAHNDPGRLVFLPGGKLRWAVVPHTTDFMIRLRPEGEHVVVEPDDLHEFLQEVVATLDEIQRAIRNFGYYPPNQICAVPTELLEQAPPPTTAVHPMAPAAHAAASAPPQPAPPRRVSSNGRTALYASARAAAAAAAASTMSDRMRMPVASPGELEKQRALLSPTHDTGNILAPFQIFNV